MSNEKKIDTKTFWSDKARAAKAQAKVTEEIAKKLAETGEALGVDPVEGLDEAIERDIEAQRSGSPSGSEGT